MSDMRAATAGEKILLRTAGQWSKLYIAGIAEPPTVFAALVSKSTWTNYDKIISVAWKTRDDDFGDWDTVVPGMTLWVGTSRGGRELGEVRVRSITDDTIFIGETSDIKWEHNCHLTVKDEFLLWPRHVLINSAGTVYMDSNIPYSDQHEVFDPVPVMGSDVVLDVEAYPVTVTFPEAADSWVFGGGAITKHFESNAGTWTNHTANNAALTIASYPANGLIRVWLTVTKSGKSTIGYRYIYVFDETHRPESVFTVGNLSADYDSGGWSFDVTAYGDLSAVRDRAKVILFAKDYYGDTQISLGQAHERENIVAIGYVNSESVEYNAEMSQVTFNVQGPQYWLNNMSGFPPGLEILGVASWTRILNLTVDKAVWHLLHWRSTATNVIDVRLSGDTRLASAFEVPAESIWAQIVKIAQTSIFANPGCNRLGQLSLEIEPQLVPATPTDPDERTWATVMELTKVDWQDKISMLCGCDRAEISMLAASGVVVNSSGVGTPYFSLSPGHVFKHYGEIAVNDQLLLSSQSQSNTLTGLMMGWKNNYYPSFDIVLAQNNRLLDVFPRSFCNIAIAAGDTVRGKAYSGNLILRSMSLEFNADTGAFTTNTNWEAETFPELSTNGDPPIGEDCGQTSCPAGQHLNSLHCCEDDGGGGGCNQTAAECAAMGTGWYLDVDKCCKYSGGPPVTAGAKTVAMLTTLYGMQYTLNFDAANPADVVWTYYNEGLSAENILHATFLHLTPDGHVYIVSTEQDYEFIAVAPALGEPFEILIDNDWLVYNYPLKSAVGHPDHTPAFASPPYIAAFNVHPFIGNFYAFIAGQVSDWPEEYFVDMYNNSLVATPLSRPMPDGEKEGCRTAGITANGSIGFSGGNIYYTGITSCGGAFNHWTRMSFNGTAYWDGDPPNEFVMNMFALQDSIWINGDQDMIFITSDENKTYKNSPSGTPAPVLWTFNIAQTYRQSIAVDPTGVVIMAAGDTEPASLTAGLWISIDTGATWVKNVPIAAHESSPHEVCIANGFDPAIWVVAREQSHILLTIDGGLTWENRTGNAVLEYPAAYSLIKQIRIGYNAPPQ